MPSRPLRLALFSGNYNYVRDGANQALNRLVDYLLRQGVEVHAYSPVVAQPAFEPKGRLVGVPSVAIPGRPEYRFGLGLGRAARADLKAFAPDIVHLASPDRIGHCGAGVAEAMGIPLVASVHTLFETYLAYYRLQALEPVARTIQRRLYRRCDAIVAPAESTAAVLRAQRMNDDIRIWSRGVDRTQFNPGRRDIRWREGQGLDGRLTIAFLGRVVMEKALGCFADAIDLLVEQGVPHQVLVIGDGPARDWFAERLPGAHFTGQLVGNDLARALASADLLFNPSITEAFGNVTLEAMACALPVVAASSTGATTLVRHEVTGLLSPPRDAAGFAASLARYAADEGLRAAHGAAGLAYAETQDWDRINGVMLDLYRELIDRRARRPAADAAR